MDGCHIFLRMFVTTIAGVSCVIRRMANFAIRIFALVAMIERKRVLDKSSGTPTLSSMARGAIGTELSKMHLGIGVTRHAIGRRAAIAILHMTFRARDVSMFAVKRKHRCMIEIF